MTPEQAEKLRRVYAGDHLQTHFRTIEEAEAAVRALYTEMLHFQDEAGMRDRIVNRVKHETRQAIDEVIQACSAAEKRWQLSLPKATP